MTLFANDKLRFLHITDMRPGEMRGTFINDNPEAAAQWNGSKMNYTDELNSYQVEFSRSLEFRQHLILKTDDELNDLTNRCSVFHSKELKNLTRYNDWNFTTPDIWDNLNHDNFWYNP